MSYLPYFKNKKLIKGAHVLVALSFIENPENKKTVNHKNGIKNGVQTIWDKNGDILREVNWENGKVSD